MASLDSDDTIQSSAHSSIWIAPSVDEVWDTTDKIQEGTLVVLSPSISPRCRWLAVVAIPPKSDPERFTVYSVTENPPPFGDQYVPILHPKYFEDPRLLFDLSARTTYGLEVLAPGGIRKCFPHYVLKRHVFIEWKKLNASGGEMLDHPEVPAYVHTVFHKHWQRRDKGKLW